MADVTTAAPEPAPPGSPEVPALRRLANTRPYLLLGQIYIGLAVIWTFSAIHGQFDVHNASFLLIAAIGLAVPILAPRDAVRHTFVSIPLLLLITYLICSVAWVTSFMPYRLILQTQVPMVIATTFVASIVPLRKLLVGLKAALLFGIAFSYLALVTDPSSREHQITDGVDFSGWRGAFEHKNGLVPFLVFALITFALFEDRKWLRNAVFVASLILTVGSQSSTGLSCIIVVACAAWWLRSYLNQDLRMSGAYVALSFFGAVAVGVLITVLLPWLVGLYGKDLTFTNRTEIWSASISAVGERPIHGYGWNGVWIEYDVEPTASLNREIGFIAGHAHNSVIEMLLQGGIIGLTLYAVFFGSVAVAGWQALRTRPDIGQWVLLFMVAQVVMGISEVSLYQSWLFGLIMMRCVLAREFSATSRGPT